MTLDPRWSDVRAALTRVRTAETLAETLHDAGDSDGSDTQYFTYFEAMEEVIATLTSLDEDGPIPRAEAVLS